MLWAKRKTYTPEANPPPSLEGLVRVGRLLSLTPTIT